MRIDFPHIVHFNFTFPFLKVPFYLMFYHVLALVFHCNLQLQFSGMYQTEFVSVYHIRFGVNYFILYQYNGLPAQRDCQQVIGWGSKVFSCPCAAVSRMLICTCISTFLPLHQYTFKLKGSTYGIVVRRMLETCWNICYE